ncbi:MULTISPECIES: hypothetical protein [unclassified Burkholderia]|uniref:hypothetical protein n=1 Tax=unclassified Burkholderia TaxID=2613784 RepID=UPI002AB06295|nr:MULTISPECIES: hypothetical protein [unclassified Burkholderia]
MPLLGSHMLTPFINRLTIAVHAKSRAKGSNRVSRSGSIRHADTRRRQASHDGAHLASSYFFDQDSLVIGAEYDKPIAARMSERSNRSVVDVDQSSANRNAQRRVPASTHAQIFILEAYRLNPQYSRAPSFHA